jgi:hypothetical protein
MSKIDKFCTASWFQSYVGAPTGAPSPWTNYEPLANANSRDRSQCGDRGGGEDSETGVSCNPSADFTVEKWKIGFMF